MKRAASIADMVAAVVKDARAAVHAGVDAAGPKPHLSPRVYAAAAQRHLPVLPVLLGHLLDPSADHLEVLASGRVALAPVDLHALHAAAAGAALQPGVRASTTPDAPVVR